MPCEKCFSDYFTCGVELLFILGVLNPSELYVWTLTTPLGAKYRKEIETDATGHFNIDLTLLPSGMFNPYAGVFVLEIHQSDDCDPKSWNDNAYCEPYSCIEFEVRMGGEPKNYIGCDCP